MAKRRHVRGRRKKRGISISGLCGMLGTILLALIILLCIPLTVPKMMGYQLYTVISGSMEPEIPVGSLVYIQGTDPSEIMEDEVIAFYSAADEGSIITHRVVMNSVAGGEFITKGDANAQADMLPVAYDHVIGKVAFSVPVLGAIAQFLTGFQGKIAAGCIIGAAIILEILAAALQRD